MGRKEPSFGPYVLPRESRMLSHAERMPQDAAGRARHGGADEGGQGRIGWGGERKGRRHKHGGPGRERQEGISMADRERKGRRA